MGKALNSSPKANCRGGTEGYNPFFGQGWEWRRVGQVDGLERGVI